MTSPFHHTPLEDEVIYAAGGVPYTGEQIAHALEASARLVMVYARADEDNGGDGHIDWEDVNDAYEQALHAMAGRVDEFDASAQQQNQCGD